MRPLNLDPPTPSAAPTISMILPHQQWWQQFLRDRGGTGFGHETYFRGGQIESVYIDMPPTGLAKFAPVTPARGSLLIHIRDSSARTAGQSAGSRLDPRTGMPASRQVSRHSNAQTATLKGHRAGPWAAAGRPRFLLPFGRLYGR